METKPELIFIRIASFPIVIAESEYRDHTQYGCPSFEWMREWLDIDTLEHVNVLWKGFRAHMFVDELGFAHGLPINPRATRVYWNAVATKKPQLQIPVYNDFTISPKVVLTSVVSASLSPIVGPALLWTGGME